MAFKVIVLQRAEADAEEYVQFIAANSRQAAGDWLQGLELEISGLAEMPQRYATIPEQGRFRHLYRHLHYHSHRVIFFVDELAQTVVVARIYHSARERLRIEDLPR